MPEQGYSNQVLQVLIALMLFVVHRSFCFSASRAENDSVRKLFELIRRLRENQEGFADRFVRHDEGGDDALGDGGGDAELDADNASLAESDGDEDDDQSDDGEGSDGDEPVVENPEPPEPAQESDVELVEVRPEPEKQKANRIALLQQELLALQREISLRTSKKSNPGCNESQLSQPNLAQSNLIPIHVHIRIEKRIHKYTLYHLRCYIRRSMKLTYSPVSPS